MIGVLALQGGFREHIEMLQSLGHRVEEVRSSDDLEKISGLVLPGGESTTMRGQLDDLGEQIKKRVAEGMPVFGTCAGVILLAKDGVSNSLGLLDVRVARNAYGRQSESFEAELEVKDIGTVPAVFIRAPVIEKANCDVLAEHDGTPVLVRQENILAATFHPELTDNTKIHELFLRMIA